MKRILALTLSLIMVLALCACGAAPAAPAATTEETSDAGTETSAAAYPTMTIQLAEPDAPSEDSSFYQMSKMFADHVAELTDGAITIEIMHSSQMGSGTDVISSMQLGTFPMQVECTNSFTNFDYNDFAMFDLPFAFKDGAQAMAWADSDAFKALMAESGEKFGVRILSCGNGFFRETYTANKEIKSLADYQGLKIRTPDTTSLVSLFKAIGANATPMAYGEVFTALQQGTVDGFEVPVSSFLAGSYYECCKYATLDNHVLNCLTIQVSEQVWQTWTPEVQAVLQEAADLAAADERAWASDIEQELIDKLEGYGVTVTTDIDTEELREACMPVWEEKVDVMGKELYDTFTAWLAEN